MHIKRLLKEDIPLAAPLTAAFRVELKSYKGICSEPDVSAAVSELDEYLRADFPMFVAMEDDKCIGYLVCKTDAPTVWVESMYVADEYRRHGVASALFCEAEKLAADYGEETVFCNVHPNNYAIIEFLRKRGYTVLNLIELRKPFRDEELSAKICVGENTFDY